MIAPQPVAMFVVVFDVRPGEKMPENVAEYDVSSVDGGLTSCGDELHRLFFDHWQRLEETSKASVDGHIIIQGLARTSHAGFPHETLGDISDGVAAAVEAIASGEFVVPLHIGCEEHQMTLDCTLSYCQRDWLRQWHRVQ